MSEHDVIVVGAGPIGLEVGAALKRAGVDYLHLEARQIGDTIARWPPDTSFFSAPERVAIAGIPVHARDQHSPTGESYLAYLRTVVELLGLEVRTYEPVVSIERTGDGFRLATETADGGRSYRCRRLVLAVGDMATPNRLGVPGEDLKHVRHVLPNPHRYFRRRLLVVGGKNSALEAALRAYRAGARVSLSYRRRSFDRSEVKPFLAPEIEMLIAKGEIRYLPETAPVEITPTHVVLAPTEDGEPTDGERRRVRADFALLEIGYAADTRLFEQAGVTLRGDERAPAYDPETMETDVPGLYVAGTAAGGTQKRIELFIETCHPHVERVLEALTGRPAEKVGSVPERNYGFELSDVQES